MYLENGVKNEVSNTIKQLCQECHQKWDYITRECVTLLHRKLSIMNPRFYGVLKVSLTREKGLVKSSVDYYYFNK